MKIFKPSFDPFGGVLGRVQHLRAGGQWIEVLACYHVWTWCGNHLLRILLRGTKHRRHWENSLFLERLNKT